MFKQWILILPVINKTNICSFKQRFVVILVMDEAIAAHPPFFIDLGVKTKN